jgi:hypothetical protein
MLYFVEYDRGTAVCGAETSKAEDGEEEEEEECGFCIFMKGGGCKESFTVLLHRDLARNEIFIPGSCRLYRLIPAISTNGFVAIPSWNRMKHPLWLECIWRALWCTGLEQVCG